MNKEMKSLIMEIFFFTFIIVISIPIWSSLNEDNLNKTEAMLSYSSNLTIDKIVDNNYNLYPMTDSYAIDNLDNNVLRISNVSNKKIMYELLFMIDNKSTLSIDNFKMKVNDKILSIKDNYLYCDDTYCYYLLDTFEIDKNNYNNIDYMLWLGEKTANINGTLTYAFETREI